MAKTLGILENGFVVECWDLNFFKFMSSVTLYLYVYAFWDTDCRGATTGKKLVGGGIGLSLNQEREAPEIWGRSPRKSKAGVWGEGLVSPTKKSFGILEFQIVAPPCHKFHLHAINFQNLTFIDLSLITYFITFFACCNNSVPLYVRKQYFVDI